MSSARTQLFAGRAYFADAGRMRAAVESLIEDSTPLAFSGEICGIFVPYGPLIEMGSIAGFAYKTLLTAHQNWERVLLLAPTPIQSALPAVAAQPAYQTFVDPMPIDADWRDAWLREGIIENAADPEPILELHAHFVLTALGQVNTLPVRVVDGMNIERLAMRMRESSNALVVCAVNLPQPLSSSITLIERTLSRAQSAPLAARSSKSLLGKMFGAKAPQAPPVTDPELQLALQAATMMKGMGASKLAVLAQSGSGVAMLALR